MTVKIERPAFNLREKLSEIDRPVGNLGTEILKTNTIDEFFHNYAIGRKNLLINGQFDIWQRGTTFANQGGGNTGYKADRWRIYSASGSVITCTRESFNVGQNKVPGNPRYMLRLSNVPDANTSWMEIEQRVEDVTRFSDRWITISFWIRANQPQYRNDYLSVKLNFGSGGSSDMQFGATPFNISTEWERKVFTYYCPTISGKTVGSSSFLEMKTLQASATQADTYYDVANFQMEYGRQATPIEQRSLGEELALCRRYYAIFHPTGQEQVYIESGGTQSHSFVNFPIPPGMRTEPSVGLEGTWTGGGMVGGRTVAGASVQTVDNGGLGSNTHPGSMGRVSVRITRSGSSYGDAEIRHTDAWQDGTAWLAYAAEL